MSLLSNQQGRPASVRARPPSRSPKGLSLAGQTILVTGLQFRQRAGDVVARSRCEALWCLGRRAQRRRLRLRARRFPARRSATPASFQILRLCESAEAREYFPTCAHSISRMQRDWLRYGPSASRYARGFEMKLAGKPSSPGLARSQHRFEASVSVFQSSSS
jgi:hypothetical protein